jgi:coenzyme Q-binding protein COQ10
MLPRFQRRSLHFKSPFVHSATRIVPFTSEQVFDVVANVDAYEEFLPFCQESRIVLRRKLGEDFEADVTIGFGMFSGTYRSRVLATRPSSIDIRAIHSSLFDFLESSWRFEDVANSSSKVSFKIEFQASSILHAHALNKVFPDIADQQLKAFENRCWKLFGR